MSQFGGLEGTVERAVPYENTGPWCFDALKNPLPRLYLSL